MGFIYGQGNKRRDVSEKKGGRVVVRGLCVESWINNAKCVGVMVYPLLYSSQVLNAYYTGFGSLLTDLPLYACNIVTDLVKVGLFALFLHLSFSLRVHMNESFSSLFFDVFFFLN